MAVVWEVLIPILACGAFLLSLPPLIVHVQMRNFAATVLVLSFGVLNLQIFLNSLIWPRENQDTFWDGKIFCDIQIKLLVGLMPAIMGAMTSILRQMAIILDTDRMTMSASPRERAQKRYFEAFFCVILPVLLMTTHYVVQPIRIILSPLNGCVAAYDNSWMSIVLQFIWPPVICLVGTFYCLLSGIRLVKQRTQLSLLLKDMQAPVRSRYIRLFGLVFCVLVVWMPFSIFVLCRNISMRGHSFEWDDVHPWDWANRVVWALPVSTVLRFDRWLQLGFGYLTFAFLGLGHDTIQVYKLWISKVGQVLSWSQMGRNTCKANTREPDI